jgi:hypothetical protein
LPALPRDTATRVRGFGLSANAALQRPLFGSSEQIENALVNALFQNRNISLIAEDVTRIKALCVTDRCRSNVDALARHR